MRSPGFRSRRRAVRAALAAIALAAAGCDRSEPAEPATAQAEAKPAATEPALPAGSIPVWRPDPNPSRPSGAVSGRFRKAPEGAAPPRELNAEQRAMIEQLESIGYATGSREAPAQRGITVHDPERAQPGLNFYTSGHAPEAVLMDMEGRVVHRWAHAFSDAFPMQAAAKSTRSHFWRRAIALPNGDLIALHSGHGILKLDRNSKLLWARPYPVHHDLDLTPEGDIVVLTRKAHMVPRVSADMPILEDFLAVIDSQGRLLRELSLIEAFENASPEHSWVDASQRFWEREKVRRRASARWGTSFDIFHTNSVQVLAGSGADRSDAFRKGNILISACHLDTIAVVDLGAEQVTWSLGDEFQLQHDPRELPDGNVMVFDNHWMPEVSRVAIVDPISGDLVWEYVGSPERPFYSRTCGTSRRLENGNILITESDGGRAFEVTRDKQIVWEFYNPNRAGDQDEYIATLFELVRLPEDFGADWLEREKASAPLGSSP
jgi:hypothetical protein